jgi:hypothetical protein
MKILALSALILFSAVVGSHENPHPTPILSAYFDEMNKGNPVDCQSLVTASDFAGMTAHGEEKRIDFLSYTSKNAIPLESINQCQKEIKEHQEVVCSDVAELVVNTASKNREIKEQANRNDSLTLSGYSIPKHISQTCDSEIELAKLMMKI